MTSPVCRAASMVDRSIHNSLRNFIYSITRHHQCVIVQDAVNVQLLQNVLNAHKHRVQTQRLFHTSRKLEIIVFGCRGNVDRWINQNTKSRNKKFPQLRKLFHVQLINTKLLHFPFTFHGVSIKKMYHETQTSWTYKVCMEILFHAFTNEGTNEKSSQLILGTMSLC